MVIIFKKCPHNLCKKSVIIGDINISVLELSTLSDFSYQSIQSLLINFIQMLNSTASIRSISCQVDSWILISKEGWQTNK